MLCPSARVMPAGFVRIAAQHAIALDLRGREHVHGGEMVFEMGLPQRCLRGPDPGRGTRQAVGGDGALGEEPIEMRFLADQPLAERKSPPPSSPRRAPAHGRAARPTGPASRHARGHGPGRDSRSALPRGRGPCRGRPADRRSRRSTAPSRRGARGRHTASQSRARAGRETARSGGSTGQGWQACATRGQLPSESPIDEAKPNRHGLPREGSPRELKETAACRTPSPPPNPSSASASSPAFSPPWRCGKRSRRAGSRRSAAPGAGRTISAWSLSTRSFCASCFPPPPSASPSSPRRAAGDFSTRSPGRPGSRCSSRSSFSTSSSTCSTGCSMRCRCSGACTGCTTPISNST